MNNLLSSFMVMLLPFMFLTNPSMIFLWIMLEMSSIMYICMTISEEENKKEWFLVYFLVQSFASAFLLVCLFSWTMPTSTMLSLENSNGMSSLIMILIMLKIAMAPFHFWLVKMSKFMSWFSMGTLLTWQKLIPLSFLSNFSMNSLLILVAMSSLMIGTLSQMKLTSMKMLIVFSSISHLGWLSIPFIKCSLTGITYLVLYSLIVLPMMGFFYYSNYLYLFNQINYSMLIYMLVFIISLSGIPPLMGFLLKWMALTLMVPSISVMMVFSLMACLSFYIYMRILYKSLLLAPSSFHQVSSSLSFKVTWAMNFILPICCVLW